MLKDLFDKIILFLFPALLIQPSLYARQDIIDNPDSVKAYLEKTQFAIDSNAEAIVLYESGQAKIYGHVVIYQVSRTIKITSQTAASEVGTIILPVSASITIEKIKATTYNLEGGNISAQNVGETDIVKHKINRYRSELRLRLPSLKVGSILHYSFSVTIYPTSSIPEWYFQHEYPTLYSKYEVILPKSYGYRNILRSYNTFTEVQKEETLDSLQAGYFNASKSSADHVHFIWTRRNIMAFKNEPFTLSQVNYTERIKIQITHMTGFPILGSWEQVCNRILQNKQNEIFYQVFQPNNFLNETVSTLTAPKTADLEKAKSIFHYIRDSFVLAKSSGALKNTFHTHQGDAQELNLLLTAMLRKAGLNSEPVIVALKPGEALNKLYPDIYDADYTISKVNINNRDYFLDAAQKYLPFGVLLPKCYNGYSRVISEKNYAVDISPDMLISQNTIMAVLYLDTNEANPKLHLKLDEKLGDVISPRDRMKWKHNEMEAQKALSMAFDNDPFHLVKVSVEHLDDPDKPLTVHYEAEAPVKDEQLIYINPFFVPVFSSNPFPPGNRKFPVDLNYRYDVNYIFRLNIPQHYEIDDYPKSQLLKFEGDLIRFSNQSALGINKHSLSLSSRFETQTTRFPVTSYKELSTFFEQMMLLQKERIVLKKVN